MANVLKVQRMWWAVAIALVVATPQSFAGKCVGATNCRVCTNCSRCGHCKAGGSCGVKAGLARQATETKPADTRLDASQGQKRLNELAKESTLNLPQVQRSVVLTQDAAFSGNGTSSNGETMIIPAGTKVSVIGLNPKGTVTVEHKGLKADLPRNWTSMDQRNAPTTR